MRRYFSATSTAASDNRQNHTSCHCQLMSSPKARRPVTPAAMPNHIRKKPGDITSSANRSAARIIHAHGPSVPLIVAAPYTVVTPPGRTRGVVVGGCLDGAGGEAELP